MTYWMWRKLPACVPALNRKVEAYVTCSSRVACRSSSISFVFLSFLLLLLRAMVVRGGVLLFRVAFPKRILRMSKLFRSTGIVAGLLLLTVAVFASSPAQTADVKKSNIVMTVGEMCGGCVKKITKRFDGVEGIAKVQCSIETRSVALIPDQGVRLSPKGVWEIMESIGKTPKKMVTPDGTFTSKPKASRRVGSISSSFPPPTSRS